MNILDDLDKIRKLDKSNAYQSIELLDKQCWDAWQKVQAIKIPKNYQGFQNIIVCGMGGSSLGAHVIQNLYRQALPLPLIITRDYHLPGFVDQNSLVILSSYSGNTEEILACSQEAIKRKLRCFVITTNGQLAEFAAKNQFPGYLIKPTYNPCGQPRMAIGYSIFGQLSLFAKLKLIRLNEKKVRQTLRLIERTKKQYSVNLPTERNKAKQMAMRLEKKIPILVSAEHLVGASHVFNNQLNENAKQIAIYYEIPELNHHLLEGMGFPKSNPKNLLFVFAQSGLYHPRNQRRIEITKEVLNGCQIKHCQIQMTGKTKLEQVFELIQFGAFAAFYLSMLNNLDPSPIPWVDFFKKKLAT